MLVSHLKNKKHPLPPTPPSTLENNPLSISIYQCSTFSFSTPAPPPQRLSVNALSTSLVISDLWMIGSECNYLPADSGA